MHDNEIEQLQNESRAGKGTQIAMHKGLTIKCLDHGYVTVRNWMGDMNDICNSARISYGEGTKSYSDDVNLVRYLLRHQHITPFESCELQVEMKLPIFVARQLVRHRTCGINEYSMRYSVATNEMYVPDPKNLGLQSTINKQGRDIGVDTDVANKVLNIIENNNGRAYSDYNDLLDAGIARELARMVLPVNTYTKWVLKVDCNNLMKMLKLRQDKHAQYEIRVYANAIAKILSIWMPEVYQAYVDYVRDAVTLSVQQMQDLRVAIKTYSNSLGISFYEQIKGIGKPFGMSKREFDDLVEMFNEG